MPGTDPLRPLASRSSFSCHPRHRERSPRQSASQNGRWWRVNLGTLQESRRPGWHWSPTGRLYEETSQYKQWYLKDQGKFVLPSCTRSRHRLLPRVRSCGATAESLVPELSQTSQNARMSGFFPPPLFFFIFVHYPQITLSTLLTMARQGQNSCRGLECWPNAYGGCHFDTPGSVFAARSTVRLSESLAIASKLWQ